MTISCIIVEDEPLARRLIEDYIASTPNLLLLKSFSNPLLALEYLRSNEVDLIFSDIQMKEITGITFLKLIPKKPLVIFTTAYPEFAIEGYELNVLDYLLKPITFERFLKAIEKVNERVFERNGSTIQTQENVRTENDFIFLKDGSKLLKVQLEDILYIEGLKDYVKVCTKEKQIVSLQTMKSLVEKLPNDRFIRIHHSTIVSFSAIEEIERDQVKIGKRLFNISDSYKKDFKAFIDSKKIG